MYILPQSSFAATNIWRMGKLRTGANLATRHLHRAGTHGSTRRPITGTPLPAEMGHSQVQIRPAQVVQKDRPVTKNPALWRGRGFSRVGFSMPLRTALQHDIRFATNGCRADSSCPLDLPISPHSESMSVIGEAHEATRMIGGRIERFRSCARPKIRVVCEAVHLSIVVRIDRVSRPRHRMGDVSRVRICGHCYKCTIKRCTKRQFFKTNPKS